MFNIAVLIPAAGASSRMRGADKLLERVDGAPLIRGAAERALSVSSKVIVTIPDRNSPRVAALSGLEVTLVEVPNAKEGMSASLRTATATLPVTINGLMILPADMPDITGLDLKKICDAFAANQNQAIVQATAEDGTPGHPVVFPSELIVEFQNLSGDTGARSVVQRHKSRVIRVTLPKNNAVTDLDTPEAWDAWRSKNPERCCG